MEDKTIDKVYTSNIAQTIEASGNFVNNIRNPSTFIIVMSFVFIGFSIYMNYSSIDKLSLKMESSIDKLSSKIEELSKSINNERIEHIKETETINRALQFKLKPRRDDE